MNISNARPVILDVDIQLPGEWGCELVRYAGIELDGILYLVDPRGSEYYSEPGAYYRVDTKEIPNYDFDDDINTMNAKYFLPPIFIDNEEIREAVKKASKTMKTRYKR